ncbi:MAG: Bcr/CflA family multidrug efflux MFS transporter [Mangrovibacterium sp.]
MKNQIQLIPGSRFFILQITFLLALLSAVSPIATDSYIPALARMSEYFQVDFHLLEISVTVYFIGVAVGQFFGGPASDAYGRKAIALFGTALFALSSFLVVFTENIHVLWFLRFTQAIGGGCASVVNMAFIRDWFEGKEVARLSSLISMVMMLAPLCAPVIGTVLLTTFGWKSIFVFMMGMSLLAFILLAIFMPESRQAALLTRQFTLANVMKSYKQIFSSKPTSFLVFANTFAVAGMFTYITGASFMYTQYYGIPETKFPLFFGGNIGMNILFTFINFRLVKKYNPESMLKIGLSLQLSMGLLGAILVILTPGKPNLWVLFGIMTFFVGSMGLIFSNITAIILNRFPQVAGSANAVIGVLRFALSGVVGSLLALFHTGNLLPTVVIMACCTILASLLYWSSKRVVSE